MNSPKKKLTEEDYNKLYIELIKKNEKNTATKNVAINLTKKEDSWTIKLDDELQNALTGGLLSLYSDSVSQNSSN